MAGVTAIGTYVPRLRLLRAAIVEAHKWADPGLAGKARGARSMCNWDEDAITMAVEAARQVVGERPPEALYLASTTAPFADRQNAGIVSTALNLPEGLATLDIGASQRAGTGALIQALAASATYSSSLVVATDHRRTKAASSGELNYGDGAVAVLVGNDDTLLDCLATHTASVDFIDHFRGAAEAFDYDWEERWIRDEGIARIIPPAVGRALEKAGVAAADVAHFIMPCTIRGGAAMVASQVGVPGDAVADNLAEEVGETGAAHPLMMLSARLPEVSADDIVVVVGVGQGCDVLVLRATQALQQHPHRATFAHACAHRVEETNYQKFLAFNDLITLERGMRAERDDYKTALTVNYRKRDMLTGLVGGRCSTCGTQQFPRTDVCVNPQCRATHTQEPQPFREAKASILTWSADYLTYTADPPSHYGMISFAEGGRFMTDFTDVAVGEIDVGMPVRMVFRVKSFDRSRGFVRYFWKAVPERGEER